MRDSTYGNSRSPRVYFATASGFKSRPKPGAAGIGNMPSAASVQSSRSRHSVPDVRLVPSGK